MALERLTIILRSLLTLKSPGDESGPLISCTCNPCQSTGTSSLVSTGDPVLSMQVINGLDRSSGFLIILVGSLERDDLADGLGVRSWTKARKQTAEPKRQILLPFN